MIEVPLILTDLTLIQGLRYHRIQEHQAASLVLYGKLECFSPSTKLVWRDLSISVLDIGADKCV